MKKSLLSISIALVLFAWLFSSCNLDQPIDLQLPEYGRRLVVECYLEAGEPMSLLLTRSSAYFDPFKTGGSDLLGDLLVSGARVIIRQGANTYELENKLTLDRFTGKFFNYTLDEAVPANYEENFDLEIITAEGDRISSSTRLLRPVEIDSIIVEFETENEVMARVLTYFTDVPVEVNYYRRMLHESSLDSLPFQDFTTSDRVVEDVVVFGTRYIFEPGDTIINTLYHISKSYYDFLESVQGAIQANGNPFAQPSPVISNIRSDIHAFGIFTTLNYDRQLTIVR